MKRWISSAGYRLRGFMQGRYGYDELFRFLSLTGVALMLLSYLPYLRFLYILEFALLAWSWVRTFSGNIGKCRLQRERYLNIRNRVTGKAHLYRSIWRDRKTHKYYQCPSCKTPLRIRKPGKGKRIVVTYSGCGQDFEKRT